MNSNLTALYHFLKLTCIPLFVLTHLPGIAVPHHAQLHTSARQVLTDSAAGVGQGCKHTNTTYSTRHSPPELLRQAAHHNEPRGAPLSCGARGCAPKDLARCSGGGVPYNVVRCCGIRPAAMMSSSIRSGVSSCPFSAPTGAPYIAYCT